MQYGVRALTYLLRTETPSSLDFQGMFATFDQIVAALSYAMCQDRTLVIDNHREWMYAPRVNCTLNGVYEPWACWFRQLSACKVCTRIGLRNFTTGPGMWQQNSGRGPF